MGLVCLYEVRISNRMETVKVNINQTDAIGARLREERNRLGYTQPEFAAFTESSKMSQVRYESGDRSPDSKYLAAISEVGADVLYILTGERRSGLPSPQANQLPERLRERLTTAIEAIEEGLAATGRTAPPDVKAELVLAAYDILASQGESAPAEIIRLVRA